MTDTAKNRKVDFEKCITELEDIVSSLESGKLSLDESLEKYKKGVLIVNDCKNALESAKLEIETIGADD